MNLNFFMQNGITGILRTAGRFYLNNGKGRAFLKELLPRMRRSSALREEYEQRGQHIPPFLIASIATQCNLRCAGCYARAGGGCAESKAGTELSGAEWARIFAEAASLGTSFVLLAGGEPLLREDVLIAAAHRPELVFPIFTNGTLLDASYLDLFDTHRNLIPVLSVEGEEAHTDARRGAGVFAQVHGAMQKLREKHILFGASVTVTRENMRAVLSPDFTAGLRAAGCGVLFYVEYVPAEKGTELLALRTADLAVLQAETQQLKRRFSDMVVLSFPGDEEAMGGCLASGRGFFHINASGGAEPCPFSPYPKYSLRETPMLEVMASGYFEELRAIAAEAGPHTGGCVLFEREAQVRALLSAH